MATESAQAAGQGNSRGRLHPRFARCVGQASTHRLWGLSQLPRALTAAWVHMLRVKATMTAPCVCRVAPESIRHRLVHHRSRRVWLAGRASLLNPMETPTTPFASCARPASTRGHLAHLRAPPAQSVRRGNTSSRRAAPSHLPANLAVRASSRQRWAPYRLPRAVSVRSASILRRKVANQAPLVNGARPGSTDPTSQGPCATSV